MALQPVVRDYEGGAVRANGNRDGRGRGMQWVERAVVETLGDRMEEDTELEEGETVEEKPPMDDLDLRFGYLDTKIEAVLGDYQREFQGSLFNGRLGSKVGIYGSFLPAHVRVPPVISGQPAAPAAVPPRSRPLEGQIERGRRIADNGSTAAPDRPVKVSPNGTGTRSHTKINGLNHSGDGFAVVPGKGTKRKDNGPKDQKNGRGITFRINLGKGANKVGKKTLYNGFGLDNSSSPSTDEDPDDILSASEDETSLERSPLDMIRVMTSFVVPRGGLLSPLCDVLIPESLERKEKPLSNAKSSKKQVTTSHALKPEPGPGPGPVATKLDNDLGKDTKVVKEKIEKVKGKPLDRREATPVVDPGKVGNKDSDNDGRTGKEGGGNGHKGFSKVAEKIGLRELDSRGDKTDRDVDLRDVVGKEGDNIRDPARISLNKVSNSFTVDTLKEDGSEFPGTENTEVRKAREESTKDLKRSREPSLEPNLKDVVAKETIKEKRKIGANKDTLKVKRDGEALPKDSQKQHYRKDDGKQVEAVIGDVLKDGPLEVKKKSKESSKGPQTQKDAKDKARDAPKEGRWETKKEISKKEALRDVDDIGKDELRESSRANIREIPKDSLKDLGKRDGPEQGLKDAKAGKKVRKGGKEPKAVSKESESGPSGDVPGLGGADSGPPAPHPLPVFAAPGVDGPAGAVAPAGHLVLDHWVQCDSCEHWRLLIPTIHIEDLPDNWLCKMMTWLPGLNNCKFSEDVTTAAVYKLLGLQHPTLGQGNPGLQAQQHLLAPAMAPPSGLPPENKMLDSKPGKVNRSASKKGMGKKLAAGTVRNASSNGRRVDTNSLKSRSLTDFGQHPVDQVADEYGLETTAAEDGGYSQVPVDVLRKVKQKEKLMDVSDNDGDDFHVMQRPVMLPVHLEFDIDAVGNTWFDSEDPEPNKQQRAKLLQDGSKLDGAGLKRKKKLGEEEYDELRAKKSKMDLVHKSRPLDENARPNSHYEQDRHSVPHASDEGGVQEGESGDRAGVNSRSVARGTASGPMSGKVNSKDRHRQPEAKNRAKGDDVDFGHQAEKRRIVSKPESRDWGASSREVLRDEKKGQAKRVVRSPRTESEFHEYNGEEQSREAESPRNERVEDVRGKNKRLFDEISGIARKYAPQSSGDRADESPNNESPVPDVGTYTERAGQQIGVSQLRSPASSASKVSHSTESSAFGSKGGSPLESTVSSSPVRSSKVDGAATGRGASKGVQSNHTTSHRHSCDKRNSFSPSPKRSLDQGADTHSDHEGPLQQSHRNWDHRPHSSDHEREFRSGRDSGREIASGRGRDDHYATSNSREGAGFRKFDTNRAMRDDDRFWEDGRDTRAGSASYFPEREYQHREDRYREDSVERYRGRDNRYERRNDRGREWDRERDRERDRSSRENWVPDRSADGHDERHSRERSLRPDRGGRPSSRESRLDKPGTWHDESRLIRDVGRDGRDRGEDDNAEIKQEVRSNHVTGLKVDHPDEDEHDVPHVQKDDFGHRYDKSDLGPPKDIKSARASNSGQASHGWEGDKVGVAFSGRKDSDAGAPRNGSEAPAMTTHVNSRSRVDVLQNGLGSTGARGKAGEVDSAAHDVRIVEDTKQGKELKKGADEERVSVAKGLGSSAHVMRSTEGASSNLSKKEHAALAKSLSEEGRHLKHTADRLKNIEPIDGESPNLYLQASLKFLLSAHHFEMASVGEGPRHGYTAQAIQLYNETARLVDFCATTYERQHDLAAAALAYNCAVVARFRGLMGKSAGLNKDCMELQSAASLAIGNQAAAVLTPPTGLPPQPPLALSRASDKPRSSHGVGAACPVGESPSSSSASDVDNLNNHALTGEKGLPSSTVKGTAPSPTPGSVGSSTELVPQRLHGSFHRMIQNGMDLFAMMESWTKAQNATAAADPWREEGMSAIRRVVEIGLLGDMDEVVRHVRLALEGIGH